PFWRPLLARRAVVPADGWYEWTGEPGRRQPWLIRARDERPILFAALTAWRDGAEGPEHGMAIVTDDAAGGMLDVHDRRPVALTPEDARAWAVPAVPWEDARDILTTPRPEDAFFWYPVTARVNSSRFD